MRAERWVLDEELRQLEAEVPLSPVRRMAPPKRPPRHWADGAAATAAHKAAVAAANRASAAEAESKQRAAAAETASAVAYAAHDAAMAAAAEAKAAAAAAAQRRTEAMHGELRRRPRPALLAPEFAGRSSLSDEFDRRPAPRDETNHADPRVPPPPPPPPAVDALKRHVAGNDWAAAARVAVELAFQSSASQPAERTPNRAAGGAGSASFELEPDASPAQERSAGACAPGAGLEGAEGGDWATPAEAPQRRSAEPTLDLVRSTGARQRPAVPSPGACSPSDDGEVSRGGGFAVGRGQSWCEAFGAAGTGAVAPSSSAPRPATAPSPSASAQPLSSEQGRFREGSGKVQGPLSSERRPDVVTDVVTDRGAQPLSSERRPDRAVGPQRPSTPPSQRRRQRQQQQPQEEDEQQQEEEDEERRRRRERARRHELSRLERLARDEYDTERPLTPRRLRARMLQPRPAEADDDFATLVQLAGAEAAADAARADRPHSGALSFLGPRSPAARAAARLAKRRPAPSRATEPPPPPWSAPDIDERALAEAEARQHRSIQDRELERRRREKEGPGVEERILGLVEELRAPPEEDALANFDSAIASLLDRAAGGEAGGAGNKAELGRREKK